MRRSGFYEMPPPNDLNIPRNYIKGSKKGESANQEHNKYGVGRVSGVRGSIRLVKLLCLLLARCFLDAYGPEMCQKCFKTSTVGFSHPGEKLININFPEGHVWAE